MREKRSCGFRWFASRVCIRRVGYLPTTSRRCLLAIQCVICILSTVARSQCAPHWEPEGGAPGTTNTIRSVTCWDPDGPGPLPEYVVVGGNLSAVGDINVRNIALWDGSAWSSLGTGLQGNVNTLGVTPDGRLYVTGGDLFDPNNPVPLNNMAVWDGDRWGPLIPSSPSLDGAVGRLLILSNGEIVAIGGFRNAGITPLFGIGRWDGSHWSRLGTGGMPSIIIDAVAMSNDDVILLGNFGMVDSVSANGIARWNGQSWSALGLGLRTNVSFGIGERAIVLPNGRLVVGGQFTRAGSVSAFGVASWNGTDWENMGNANAFTVNAFALDAGDTLYMCAPLFNGTGRYLHRWNGTSWNPLPAIFTSIPSSLTFRANGDLIAFGSFSQVDQINARNIARFDGTMWSPLNAGSVGGSDGFRALLPLPDARVLAGGDVTQMRGVPIRYLGERSETGWSPFAGGANAPVSALLQLRNGDIIVGGAFTQIGTTSASRIARWNGTNWSTLGSGMDGDVLALAEAPDGRVIAGGAFIQAGGTTVNRVATWNGQQWLPMRTGMNGNVTDLAALPNGDVVARGGFSTSGGNLTQGIARWTGVTWFRLLGEITDVNNLGVSPNGELLGSRPNGIYAWRGDGWYPYALGSGIGKFVVRSDGHVLASGFFPGPSRTEAIWNGISWNVLPSNGPGAPTTIWLTDGSVASGGNITSVNGLPSLFYARWKDASRVRLDAQTGDTRGCSGQELRLSVAASGDPPLRFQWRKDGVDVLDSDRVSGSNLTTLVIQDIRFNDRGVYACEVTGACTQLVSQPARVSMCAADMDDGTSSGSCDLGVTVEDLLYYLDQYAEGAARADLDDGSGAGNPDGGVTIDDLSFFLMHYEAGC